jgi:hypothetical protein
MLLFFLRVVHDRFQKSVRLGAIRCDRALTMIGVTHVGVAITVE